MPALAAVRDREKLGLDIEIVAVEVPNVAIYQVELETV
jgi:hypothetical protein